MEQTFLEPELPFLTASFERVVVVPGRRAGQRQPVPAGVEVSEGLAEQLEQRAAPAKLLSQSILSWELWQELAQCPRIIGQSDSLRRLLRFLHVSRLTSRWTARFLAENRLQPNTTLLYTYWFLGATHGLGTLKRQHPRLKLISRAHGHDLYAERHNPAYMPLRTRSLAGVDRVFTVSDHGRAYLAEHFPQFSAKTVTARLGVSDWETITVPSADGFFRIVSCSSLLPVKRIDLLIRGLARAAERRPSQRWDWQHYGDGPLRPSLQALAGELLPARVQTKFSGFVCAAELKAHYRQRPVDLFMNVSVSEGISVAMMEAICCGMPILATAVGGTPEIVSSRNGQLLSPNPTPDEIANGLLHLLDDDAGSATKRSESRQIWQDIYCAEHNYRQFALELVTIRQAA